MRLQTHLLFAALAALLLGCGLPLRAADSTSAPVVVASGPVPLAEIRLWEQDAPGALGSKRTDIPTLIAYLPEPSKRNGATMVVVPGGGYGYHAEPGNGKTYAEWLVANGITAYDLHYRLGPIYHHPAMLNDAARAVRLARFFARRDGLDPTRVGIIGSSAGGHLASTLATHYQEAWTDSSDPIDRESARPDLAVLCFAVISLREFVNVDSRTMLLGNEPPADLVQNLSNELQVTRDTPPCFLWHTTEDKSVPVENSMLFAAALRRAGVPFSLHIYETGPHGLGLGRPGRPAPPWSGQLLYWFKERKFIP